MITLDGPSGTGKSTAARLLAQRLRLFYLDTGAMYRAMAWKSLRAGLDPRDRRALVRFVRTTRLKLAMARGRRPRVWVDGREVTRAIRTAAVAARASEIAVIPALRRALVAQQRRLGRAGDVVAEGRDTGTVVFPEARWKFFLTASAGIRARRRWRELRRAGASLTYRDVLQQVTARDRRDSTRAASPLRRAADARIVDTSRLTPAQTVRTLLRHLKRHPPWFLAEAKSKKGRLSTTHDR